MEWMVFAAASAFTFALVSVLDKILISDHVGSGKIFVAGVGGAQVLLGIATLPLATFSGFDASVITVALLSGVFSGTYLIGMFIIMESQDVSRVVPVVSTYPIFVAFLAFLFLDEHVSIFAWACVIVTVVGAAMVSLAPKSINSTEGVGILALLFLLLASMSFGLSQFLSKTIAEEMTMWTQYSLRAFGGGITCGLLIFLPGVRQGLVTLFTNFKTMMVFSITEIVLVFFAILFFFLSVYSGEIYLTATVMATRPLFVFGLTLLLSIPMIGLFKESVRGKAMATRATGIVLTVGGVIGVSLT
ncbi:MAG: EamA family transporter [Chloroflexota bacterium]|nr:EamA family transporter [Chloroflexota bacterium]MEC9437840.1 EamA family transporter [Chloroflexota bacterium]MED5429386.1 EamA family transporter [Chloroflexota bacterium]MQF66574.1 hypothetical protein [SAR202 cluster bacterium AC-647-P02_OGT_505m]|tara:strand:+ start:1546 stop:2451 length:906 start_codon:yes stop_codon:yes gene_type:complete